MSTASDTQGPASSAQPAVVVEAVSKRFGTLEVVRDLSFEVRPGELLGFLGPNGAGKTTMMRMILDVIRPDRGHITVFGGAPGVAQQHRIGYLPEERGLYRDVPVLETLTYFAALKGLPEREANQRAQRMLEEVGLGDVLHKKAAELSRGMQQKAQVIATIVHQPDLLVIDEPFQGLDPVNREMLRQVVLAQRDRGAAVIMSTHDMEEAQSLCDRILLINEGRRLLYGSVRDVRHAFDDGAVVVRGDDVPIDATRLGSVDRAYAIDGAVRYVLRSGASASDLFRELAAANVTVESFEVDAPSLNEVFLRAVEADAAPASRSAA